MPTCWNPTAHSAPDGRLRSTPTCAARANSRKHDESPRCLSRGRLKRDPATYAGLAMWLHYNFDVLLEHGEHFHQPFGGIILEVAAQQMGKVGLGNTQQFGGLDLS